MIGTEPGVDTSHGFDFLSDPVLVVTLEGHILEVNTAAKATFGPRLSGGTLADIVLGDPMALAQFLRRASGSTSPRPGKFAFNGKDGRQQLRIEAARSRQIAARPQVILRLLSQTSDRFAMLDRRVKDLDAQLHQRLQKNAELHEALRQNQTLLRELQHRVKNNIQMMMSLIKISARGHESPNVAAVIHTLSGRLRAMAAAQEALYQADKLETVSSQCFLEDVVRSAARACGAMNAVSLTLDDAELSSYEAHNLALIANELLTNAAKHGLRNGQGRISVTFADNGDHYSFGVADDGPGIPPDAASRSSGLALVRGLCRQIGGRLEIDSNNGTRCTVEFRADRQKKMDA
ncbi:MAG: ATP-binding protein [Pararhodobacter sp.]|nr:ATP-binding protein [Pararhodobacter sp.]